MIFIDTGAFFARFFQRDQHHRAATELWKTLNETDEKILTSNFVLDETLTLLARRAGYRFAASRARSLYSSNVLTILRPNVEDEVAAIDLFEKYADQQVSFTDCVSFVLMKRERVRRVFTFDGHFERANFVVCP